MFLIKNYRSIQNNIYRKILITKSTIMYIAYSALNDDHNKDHQTIDDPTTLLRYRAYQQACKKHQAYIAQIQKYIPGWFPKFDYNTK